MAIQNHDTTGLDKSLAPEFILRTADEPERILQGSTALQELPSDKGRYSFEQSDMSVRVFPGDAALVSFIESQTAESSRRNRFNSVSG